MLIVRRSMSQIIAVSTNVTLLTTLHDILRSERHTLLALLSYERFERWIANANLRGIVCIDLAAPDSVLYAIEQYLSSFNGHVTIMLISETSALADHHAFLSTHALPAFVLPADAKALLQFLRLPS